MQSLKCILLMGLSGSAMIASAAQAQDAGGAGNNGEALVVTGSRIARPELESPMPVSVTRMDDALAVGRVTAYDALKLDPALGVGLNLGQYQSSSSGDGGTNAGISAVNLRNLGAARTLTLINGQRRVSSGSTSSEVDLNMIPVGMIDRIEVVTGGAAAVYGADAVTGAVNIITRRHMDGLKVTASYGISQRGDGNELMVSAATGGKFADGRGSFAIGGTYSNIDSLSMEDRISAAEGGAAYFANPANTGPADGIADNVPIWNVKNLYLGYEPSYYLAGKHYVIENGVPRDARCDRLVSGGPLQICDGAGSDGKTPWTEEQIRGGMESVAIMANVDYELTDNIRYSADFSFANAKFYGFGHYWHEDSRNVYFKGAGGSVAYIDNPYLPDAMRQQMLAEGVDQVFVSRSFGNFPIQEQNNDRTTFSIAQSLGGGLIGGINWQAFWQYGRTETDAVRNNIPWQSHWLAARDVIADENGNPVCRDEAARAAGCLPLNIVGVDAPSDELLAYVMADAHNRRTNTLETFGANLSGALFALPHGDVSIALGVEHRREALATTIDPMIKNRELVHTFSAVSFEPELNVDMKVTELFGEAVVPLLRDTRFARRLELEAAYRYSDYNTVGSTSTWKVGGTWEPFAGLIVRGTRSRSVRVPNFGELYAPQSISAPAGYVNPCDVTGYYQSATRTANCQALGIAQPLPATTAGQSIPLSVVSGGNADLRPEISNSLTLGAILQPAMIPGLSVTADYWDINIEDAITSFSFTQVLNLCVDLPTTDNGFCSLITFDNATKLPSNIQATAVNAASQGARGVDLGATYRRPLGGGMLNLSLKGTWLIRNVTQSTPGISTGNVINHGDWRNNQRFRATLLTAYDFGKLNIALNTQFMSASKYDPNAAPEQYEINDVPAMIYNDLSVGYDISDNHNITVGVRNMFDTKVPHLPHPVFTNYQVFDRVGRYFFATANMKF